VALKERNLLRNEKERGVYSYQVSKIFPNQNHFKIPVVMIPKLVGTTEDKLICLSFEYQCTHKHWNKWTN